MLCLPWCDFTNFKQCPCDCTSVACSNEASPMFWRLEDLDSGCGDRVEEKNAHLDSLSASWKIFLKVIFTFATVLVNNLPTACEIRNHYSGEHIICKWTSYQGKYFVISKQCCFLSLKRKKKKKRIVPCRQKDTGNRRRLLCYSIYVLSYHGSCYVLKPHWAKYHVEDYLSCVV